MSKKAKHLGGVLILHGPNLNLLGSREPEIYGSETLAAIDRRLAATARTARVRLTTFQSNHEGDMVDRVHQAARERVGFIVVNPAAFTHTSIALRDALAAADIPFIEVHLSNVHAREAFRRHSYLADVAVGTIAGLGSQGYDMALAYALRRLSTGRRRA
jgi:3-dehydroquinate dehydratase II